ncbi:MAG: LPS export ABC transporter permease LptF [Gammaproteobacteria bacterium]|nr:LPS export ABC transporter permease LptF [Gammaproteobacteria bacterium]
MGNIITGYLAREILKTSFATLLVLYIILVSNALGRVLADIADGDIPRQALWPVLLSQSINILSLLLPIGLFLGIIFAFGRMYKDHEIVVMNACGIGYREFYKPVALILLPVLIFSAYASLWLNAQVQRQAQAIIDHGENQHEFQQIKPGQFNQSKSGDLVFFMESISDDRLELKDIIISQAGDDYRVLETASSGRQKVEEKTGDLFLVVGPGERYEGRPGAVEHKIVSFDQHGILMENKSRSSSSQKRSDQMTLAELWASQRLAHRAELHWRVAVPVVLLVLGLVAVPLSYIAPRKGRFGKVGYALLIYILYFNLMALTRAQLEAGSFPFTLNFWWVHLAFLCLALGLLYQRNRGIVFAPKAT